MLENLKENELQVATKLIFDGLSMAKVSMEQILQSPVEIKRIDYGSDTQAVPDFRSKKCDNVHVIKTALIGQLQGTSYLIFTEKEVTSLYKACLPAELLAEDSPESTMMKIGFLTEIDNMVAAAVITEFSNFLGVDMYGHVPSLHVMDGEEVNGYLQKETNEIDSIVHFKAIFHNTEIDIAPDFIWIFQDEFVNKIKNAV